jgi:pilus assembly protein CpaB
MNLQRLLILGLAAIAAGAAALIVRGLMGGGAPQVQAALPRVVTQQVLVAASDLQPGEHLTGSEVKWQSWPKSSIDSSFITNKNAPTPQAAVNGTVVRAPIVAGQPITNANIVHADAAGIMAATLTPGMRAIAIPVTTETGAGGFILPNDRVDVISNVQTSEGKRFRSSTLLENLRVLAMDQTYKEDKNQKVVIAKTATLEVTPAQAEQIMQAQGSGTLSLSLRSLADSTASALADSALGNQAGSNGSVAIVRYGLPRTGGEPKGE